MRALPVPICDVVLCKDCVRALEGPNGTPRGLQDRPKRAPKFLSIFESLEALLEPSWTHLGDLGAI